MTTLEIEQLKKNNELFANALTLKIVGEQKFKAMLSIGGGYKKAYIDEYSAFIKKYLTDYEDKIQIQLEKLKK